MSSELYSPSRRGGSAECTATTVTSAIVWQDWNALGANWTSLSRTSVLVASCKRRLLAATICGRTMPHTSFMSVKRLKWCLKMLFRREPFLRSSDYCRRGTVSFSTGSRALTSGMIV